MVEEILQMTFPMFLDSNAGFNQFFKNKEVNPFGMLKSPENLSQSRAGDNFWTEAMVRKFIWKQGSRD